MGVLLWCPKIVTRPTFWKETAGLILVRKICPARRWTLHRYIVRLADILKPIVEILGTSVSNFHPQLFSDKVFWGKETGKIFYQNFRRTCYGETCLGNVTREKMSSGKKCVAKKYLWRKWLEKVSRESVLAKSVSRERVSLKKVFFTLGKHFGTSLQSDFHKKRWLRYSNSEKVKKCLSMCLWKN